VFFLLASEILSSISFVICSRRRVDLTGGHGLLQLISEPVILGTGCTASSRASAFRHGLLQSGDFIYFSSSDPPLFLDLCVSFFDLIPSPRSGSLHRRPHLAPSWVIPIATSSPRPPRSVDGGHRKAPVSHFRRRRPHTVRFAPLRF